MTETLTREHMDRAVGRYSSLFTLPSHKDITLLLCIECAVTGVAATLPYDISFLGLAYGLTLGMVLFLTTLLGNYLAARVLLGQDLILDLRRCLFLSLASNLILLVFASTASVTSVSLNNPDLWSKTVSLGVFASLALRFLVFYAVSLASSARTFLSAVLQPALFLSSLLIIPLSFRGLGIQLFLYLVLAVCASFAAVQLFIATVNRVGLQSLGVPSIGMFKAFLANWTEDLENPLEEVLESLSEERAVKVSMIGFKAGGRMKATIVVPGVHPGPFKNVGSSPIPNLIQKLLEEKLSCVVAVPHGISGHELDLSSQRQNGKVLNRILEASEFKAFHPYATPFLSLRRDNATVGCQVFGDCALLTLTLAPQTMEDLPAELDDTIIQEAKRKGLDWAIAIDAHNSLQGSFDSERAVADMKEAAVSALKKAVTLKQSSFEVGAAKTVLKEFGVREGMGPGGVSVLITSVRNQKTAFVIIDGNNMVSGLREKILSSLEELGIENGEIMTTDTHTVNAAVMADRGYHPVGEAVDQDQLIRHIKAAAAEALGNLEPAEASWCVEEVPAVKIIGERQIDRLSLMIDEAARKAKKVSTIIFPVTAILLTALIVFI